MNKIYKGVIHSLLPQKGFGFITPIWANGDSEENIFFHLSETKGGKCYIPALASVENRTEVVSKKGTKTLIPVEPQVVFFQLEAEDRSTGVKLIAKKIRDSKNVSDEEAIEADTNITKPSAEELLHPEEGTVNVAVTLESIQQVKELKDDNAVIEEVEENQVVDNAETSNLALYSEEELQASDEDYKEEEEDDIDYEEDDSEDKDDYYQEKYGDLQDAYDQSDAKSSKRYPPKDNSKDK